MGVHERAEQAVQSYLQTAKGKRFAKEGRVFRVMTPSGARYVYVSDNCPELLGFTPEELLGQSAFDQVFNDDVYRIRGVLDAAQEAPTHSYFRTRHRDRNPVWVEADTVYHDGFIIAALRATDPPQAGAGWKRIEASS